MDFLNNIVVDITKSFQEVSLKILPPPPTATSTLPSTNRNNNDSINNNNNNNEVTPSTDPDKLTAKELMDMSPNDRTKIFDDLHGVGQIIDETPESISVALKELDDELQKISKKPAYDVACLQSIKFVNDNTFRLMFLRATEYNPQEAAQKIIRYFEEKRTLFGDVKLTKYITLNDLKQDDLDCVNLGSLQILSSPDRSGRLVAFNTPQNRFYKTFDNLARAYWYTLMVGIRNHETSQRKGMVALGYDATDIGHRKPNLKLILLTYRLHKALPLRFSSIHYCVQEESQHIKLLRLFSGTSSRRKTRVHSGSPLECRHSLLTYGIIQETLPLDNDGILLIDQHQKWIEQQLLHEESIHFSNLQSSGIVVSNLIPYKTNDNNINNINAQVMPATMDLLKPFVKLSPDEYTNTGLEKQAATTTTTILCEKNNDINNNNKLNSNATSTTMECIVDLGPFDVPFGRGSSFRTFAGYEYFRQLIDKYSHQYETSTKFDKTALTGLVMKMIHEKGGRFVINNDGNDWIEVDAVMARKKVANAFRSKRKPGVR